MLLAPKQLLVCTLALSVTFAVDISTSNCDGVLALLSISGEEHEDGSSRDMWTVEVRDQSKSTLSYLTFYPEAVASLLLGECSRSPTSDKSRVFTLSEIQSTALSLPEYTISNGILLRTASAYQIESVQQILSKNGVSLKLERADKSPLAALPKAGSINYRSNRTSFIVELTHCRGRVGSYSGAFLVHREVLLAADYGSTGSRHHSTSGKFRKGEGLRLSQLEAASFRTFDVVNSGHGKILKTSSPLDFNVNHFSGWAHWHARQSSASEPAQHQRRTRELSRIMNQECSSIAPKEKVSHLNYRNISLGLVPFWGGTVLESGGNAHYDAPSREVKLEIASGTVCSVARYFQRVMVGVCGEDDGKDLYGWLSLNWNVNVIRADSGLLSKVAKGADILIVQFECSKGAHLPYHLLEAAQAQIQARNKYLPSTKSYFSSIELVYYTEADQPVYFRDSAILNELSKLLIKSNVAAPRDQVVVVPQRLNMKFRGDMFEDLADLQKTFLSGKTQNSFQSFVEMLTRDPHYRLEQYFTLSNSCADCPPSLCPSITTDKASMGITQKNDEPVILQVSNGQRVEFDSVEGARRHWLILHGFDPRDVVSWPSLVPSTTPSINPSPSPSRKPSLKPTHQPTSRPSPGPTPTPPPLHPIDAAFYVILALAGILVALAKSRQHWGERILTTSSIDQQSYEKKSHSKQVPSKKRSVKRRSASSSGPASSVAIASLTFEGRSKEGTVDEHEVGGRKSLREALREKAAHELKRREDEAARRAVPS